jgi:hypothetical protein
MTTQSVSKQTQRNWWVDAALFLGAVISALSGIYFLFLPVGGYQGGRNPYYGIVILFQRATWEDLHTWGGIAMIGAAILHLVIHWSWVVNMTRRVWKEVVHPTMKLNARSKWNYLLNATVAVSFLLTAASGIYFLFVPGGNWYPDPSFLFSRTTWDMIHTWAAVVLIGAAVLHFAIHWNWVTKVTCKMFEQVTRRKSASSKPTFTESAAN